MPSLTVTYDLASSSKTLRSDVAPPQLPGKDQLDFKTDGSLESLGASIRAARKTMNTVLTVWKDVLDEKELEKQAEVDFEAQRRAAEQEKFIKGEPDESDEEVEAGDDALESLS